MNDHYYYYFKFWSHALIRFRTDTSVRDQLSIWSTSVPDCRLMTCTFLTILLGKEIISIYNNYAWWSYITSVQEIQLIWIQCVTTKSILLNILTYSAGPITVWPQASLMMTFFICLHAVFNVGNFHDVNKKISAIESHAMRCVQRHSRQNVPEIIP